MNLLSDLTRRIAALEARVQNILQEGIVKVVHVSENLLDIEVRGVTFEKVPYLTRRAGTNGKTYWVPEVNESGFLLCPDGQAGNAIFLPALNTSRNPAPRADENIALRQWKDSFEEEFDGNSDTYELRIPDANRKTAPDEIEDKVGDAAIRKIEADEITDSVGSTSPVKMNLTTTEGKIEKGVAKVSVSATEVDIVLSPAVKLELRAAGITLKAPIFSVNAPVFNWNGVPTTPIAWVAIS